MVLLRIFIVREDYRVEREVSGKGDTFAGAASLPVPEIAALPHAGADVREGADGGGVVVHLTEIPQLFNIIFLGYIMPSTKDLNIFGNER